jgi:L-iditol 2-dehydrogenase
MSVSLNADSRTMLACVLDDVQSLEVREVTRPDPGPYDVLVRVAATGLCGTDLHIFGGDANYNTNAGGQPVPLTLQPQILGHEIAGIVEIAGSEVSDLRTGDRVAVDQGLNCMSRRRQPKCEYCASSDSHQCEFYGEHGITGLPGGLAEYISLPAANCVRIESDLEFAQAVLTEPLACIIHSFDLVAKAAGARYAIGASDSQKRVRTALVVGAGPAGLLFVQYLRRVLAFDGIVLVSEPNQRKRELAKRFGAEVIDPGAVDLVAELSEITAGRLVEFVIECSGAGEVFSLIPGLLRKQGTVLLYSHGQSGVELNLLNPLQFKEPTLVSPVGGSGGFDDDGRPSVYRRALQLLERGEVEVAPFVTHRYRSLDDVSRAFTVDFHKPDYIKGVVELL